MLPADTASIRRDRFFCDLRSRCTRREFNPISGAVLGELLWFCGKTLELQHLGGGHTYEHRCCPSAGGIHPVDILLVDPSAYAIRLYDPLGHALWELGDVAEPLIRQFCEEVNRVVEVEAGRIICFAAEFDRTLTRYLNGESLVWRDVGVLVATFCYVAEALQLNCCPIGIHGEPWVSQMLHSSGRVIGVGGCVIGSRPPLGRRDSNTTTT